MIIAFVGLAAVFMGWVSAALYDIATLLRRVAVALESK